MVIGIGLLDDDHINQSYIFYISTFVLYFVRKCNFTRLGLFRLLLCTKREASWSRSRMYRTNSNFVFAVAMLQLVYILLAKAEIYCFEYGGRQIQAFKCT